MLKEGDVKPQGQKTTKFKISSSIKPSQVSEKPAEPDQSKDYKKGINMHAIRIGSRKGHITEEQKEHEGPNKGSNQASIVQRQQMVQSDPFKSLEGNSRPKDNSKVIVDGVKSRASNDQNNSTIRLVREEIELLEMQVGDRKSLLKDQKELGQNYSRQLEIFDRSEVALNQRVDMMRSEGQNLETLAIGMKQHFIDVCRKKETLEATFAHLGSLD
jgi:hypothetical protein